MQARVKELKPFWMVYGLQRSAPTVRHMTPESALSEATRLARANPGEIYVVLAATHGVVKQDVEIVPLGSAGVQAHIDFDEIPGSSIRRGSRLDGAEHFDPDAPF